MSRALAKLKKKLAENIREKIAAAYASTASGRRSPRHNLFTKSQRFDDGVWTKNEVTLVMNAVAGDGTLSAFGVVPTAENSNHGITRVLADAINEEFISIFVDFKPSASQKFRISIFNSSLAEGFDFAIDTSTSVPSIDMTLGSTLASLPSEQIGTVQDFRVKPIGDGFYRATIVTQSPNILAGANGIASRTVGFYLRDTNGNSTFVGDGVTAYTILWRAQAEYSSSPSEYQWVDTEFNYARLEEESLRDEGDRFFLFVGNPRQDASASPEYDSDFYATTEPWRNMMFGKRIGQDDTRYMTRKIEWAAGKRFSAYDHKDPNLEFKEFYAIVDRTRVYKCINNAGGKASTIKPTSTVPGIPFRLSDGYVWLYMYSLTSSEYNKFQTDAYMPVIQDPEVKAAAIDGSIMALKIINGGSGYPFLRGKISAFQDTEAQANPTSVLMIDIDENVRVDGNPYTQENYFSRCAVIVEDASSGYKEVVEIYQSIYTTFVNDGATVRRLKLRLSEPVRSFTPSVGSSVSIAPNIWVRGYNRKERRLNNLQEAVPTTACISYAIVNEANGAISDIVIVGAGSGYREAYVEVVSNKSDVTPAEIEAVISPPGGHGYDVVSELYAKNLGISVRMDSSSFPLNVSYGQIGLLANPLRVSGFPFGKDDETTATIIEDDRDANHFSQILEVSITPIDGSFQQFSPGEEVFTEGSERRGVVAYANSTVVGLVGVDGQDVDPQSNDFFTPEEILTTANGHKKWRIQSDVVNRAYPKVNKKPDLLMYSGEIHYLQNINSVTRPADADVTPETVKLILKF